MKIKEIQPKTTLLLIGSVV